MGNGLREICAVLVIGFAWPVSAHADDLPQVDSKNEVVPLRPDQLTAAEQSAYSALPSGSDEAARYLVSRSWMRFCKPVADGVVPAKSLPLIPPGFDQKHLSTDELAVCKVAIRLFFRPA